MAFFHLQLWLLATRLLSVPELLDVEDLCRLLRLTRKGLYNRRYREGALPPAIKIGPSLRWRPSDVEAWIEQNREGVGR